MRWTDVADCGELTSKRIEPFLSMSNALNRKCAYVVASENKWHTELNRTRHVVGPLSFSWNLFLFEQWLLLLVSRTSSASVKCTQNNPLVYTFQVSTSLREKLWINSLECFFIHETAGTFLLKKKKNALFYSVIYLLTNQDAQGQGNVKLFLHALHMMDPLSPDLPFLNMLIYFFLF